VPRSRIGVSVCEAAFLLSLSESQVRYRLRTGRLGWAVKPSRVEVESLRHAFPNDATRQLRERVLGRLLVGAIAPPRLGSRYGRYSFDQLYACAITSAPSAGNGL
jgi:hypothetical protein